MARFAERMKYKSFRLSNYRIRNDDYEFTLGGEKYYVDAKVGNDKSFLTIVALDELKEANSKIAALEKRVAELTLQNIYLTA